MRLYDRVYRLEVGDEGETLTVDGFEGEPARITFNVFQGTSSYVTIAQIQIYGLSRQSRQKTYAQYSRVKLTAGYREQYGTIFSGTIYNVGIGRNGPENYVELFCRSAGQNWEDAFINRSFGAGTPAGEVIRGVAEGFGAPVDMVGDFSDLPTLQDTLPVSQDCKTWLYAASDNFGFKWGYEGNRVVIYRDGAERDATHVTSALTGMVGTPRIRERGIDVTVKMNTRVRIYDKIEVQNVTGQLAFNNPDAVRFEDSIGTGTYKIQSYTHVGDFYGDSWDTIIEGLNTRVGTPRTR